ncbi:MAG: hypothetical protein E4H17_01430 [Gemmatimonadales bacterium]|nr:MAG: hypothetical protein E4H17_01430 [Gemmatimonadales bacterium]
MDLTQPKTSPHGRLACGACHMEMKELPHATALPQIQRRACHEAQGNRETYGLPTRQLTTYRDFFHKLASHGGSKTAANCPSCHGFHKDPPSSDPRSAVSSGRLGETCGKRHSGASTWSALGRVPVVIAAAGSPILILRAPDLSVAHLRAVGLRRAPPAFDRFTYVEKAEYSSLSGA